jgi:hypothetical protein
LLLAAAGEGLAPNLARFMTFLGWTEGELFELQSLEVPQCPRPWRQGGNYVAHATTIEQAAKLASEADGWGAMGVFAVLNALRPALAARHAHGVWHPMKKGASTEDPDILARRALYLDLDAERPKGVSSLAPHLARTAERAEQLAAILARHIPREAIGWGLSGNGAAIFLALAMLPCDEETDRLGKALLAACSALVSDPRAPDKHTAEERLAVSVDTSVCDRRRLCPAFGTMKRKGQDVPDRPHRRTAFLAPSAPPHRLTLADLRALVAGLRAELVTDDARAAVDAALAGAPQRPAPKPAAPTAKPASSSSTSPQGKSPAQRGADTTGADFQRAREIPVGDVLAALGLLDGDQPVCPGCRSADSGVAIVGNGLKCSHNRCSDKGHSNGFRTTIDVVQEAQGLDAPGALGWLREAFPGAGIEPPHAPRKASPAANDQEHEQGAEPFLPLETTRDLPPFPLAALPPAMATFVSQVARNLECPPDLPAVLALGALASVCMKRYAAEPRPDWQEPLNLYLAVALEPGESKSPAFKQVFAPLYALQKAMREAWEEDKRRQEEAKAEEAKAEDGKPWGKRSAKKGPEEPPPPCPRLFIDDATAEKTAAVLAEQGERLTLASDEGTAFAQMTGIYSKNGQANVSVWLKSHDGGELVVDRMSRDPIRLENPLMTMALAVQPTVIRELAKRPDLRGRGLWSRFSFVFPQTLVGTRTFDAPPVDPRDRAAWHDLVRGIARGGLPAAPAVIRFSAEAWGRLRKAIIEVDRAQVPGGSLASVSDWASKLRGLIVRLAGLLHVADEPLPERALVSPETIERALTIARYFTAHSLFAFNVEMTLDPIEQAARAAWAVIERKGVPRVTPSALASWAQAFRKVPAAIAALDALVARGYLAPATTHKGRAYVVRQRGASLSNPVETCRNPVEGKEGKNIEKEENTPPFMSSLSGSSDFAPSGVTPPPPPPPSAVSPPDRDDRVTGLGTNLPKTSKHPTGFVTGLAPGMGEGDRDGLPNAPGEGDRDGLSPVVLPPGWTPQACPSADEPAVTLPPGVILRADGLAEYEL